MLRDNATIPFLCLRRICPPKGGRYLVFRSVAFSLLIMPSSNEFHRQGYVEARCQLLAIYASVGWLKIPNMREPCRKALNSRKLKAHNRANTHLARTKKVIMSRDEMATTRIWPMMHVGEISNAFSRKQPTVSQPISKPTNSRQKVSNVPGLWWSLTTTRILPHLHNRRAPGITNRHSLGFY